LVAHLLWEQEAGGSSPPSPTSVMSRDIPDGCRETSRTHLVGLWPARLVVTGRVDDAVAGRLTGLTEHWDVSVSHYEQDSPAGTRTPTSMGRGRVTVTQRQLARLVQAVPAQAARPRPRGPAAPRPPPSPARLAGR
jgi:hypothetical protein